MLRLWNRMRGIFGTTWTRERGDIDGETAAVWTDGLSGLTLDQMKRGIEQCIHWDESFPPNLPQFMKLCLTKVPEPKPKALKREKTGPVPENVSQEWKKTRRESTERDQSFVDSFNHLCRARWGALSEEQEKRYREAV